MRDISDKYHTLRTARARAQVFMKRETVNQVRENKTLKPDVLPTARAASFLAVKNTWQAIPHCHPLPVEHVQVEFTLGESVIEAEVRVKAVYKTGVEMEALYGASVAALTIYDMLKPQDSGLRIGEITLLEKRGGKDDFGDPGRPVTAAVIVVSDTVATGKKEDRSGKAVTRKLEKSGVRVSEYKILPDEPEQVRENVKQLADAGRDLVVVTGGTGISPRDQTPEALRPLLDREISGIMEAARAYGQQRTPYSMLSRGIAGLTGRTLVLAIPGSPKGAAETMNALFPGILHVFKALDRSYRHEDMPPE